MTETYWNGEKCKARKCRVLVGTAAKPTFWHAGLNGTERKAVEVSYYDQTFLLDNEDGSGWNKVTVGHGGPDWGHSSLPRDSIVLGADFGNDHD